MLAAAMGLQTAVLARVGSLTVHTTFVTGILNHFAELVSNVAFLAWDEHRGAGDREERAKLSRQALFIFMVWFCYVAGATGGAALATHRGSRALFIPVCIVLAAMLTDCVHPLGVAEEHRFPES